MLVNVKNVKQIFINLKATFQKAFDQSPTDWQKVAMEVPSNGKENDYSWLSRFPKMREWIGDKVVKSLAAFNYTIRNKDWEATVEVDRNDIEDDQIMGYALQAKGADSRQQSYRQILWRPLSVTVLPIPVTTVRCSLIPTTWSPVNRCPTKAPKNSKLARLPRRKPPTVPPVRPCVV